jgi:isocitrate/isopropylmalate dehydrogenase
VEAVVQAGETTRDVGGSLGTREAGDAILKRLK